MCASGRHNSRRRGYKPHLSQRLQPGASESGAYTVAMNLVAFCRNRWSSRCSKVVGIGDWSSVRLVFGEVWRANDSHKLTTSHTILVFLRFDQIVLRLNRLVLLLERRWVNLGSCSAPGAC